MPGGASMRKETTLSRKQEDILEVIRSSIRQKGYPPSVREIGEAVGLKSPSTVHMHLNKLEQLGAIRRESDKNRAIEIVGSSPMRNISMVSVPLIGRVTAGQPILAVENIEETYPLPTDLVGHDDVFMLKVDGESMIQAGILDGDYVIVRDQDSARNGDIIVALVDGDSATVKRFFHEKDRIRLQPENDSMEPIYSTDVSVLGKVVGVYRKM
jgi:repressor LexA